MNYNMLQSPFQSPMCSPHGTISHFAKAYSPYDCSFGSTGNYKNIPFSPAYTLRDSSSRLPVSIDSVHDPSLGTLPTNNFEHFSSGASDEDLEDFVNTTLKEVNTRSFSYPDLRLENQRGLIGLGITFTSTEKYISSSSPKPLPSISPPKLPKSNNIKHNDHLKLVLQTSDDGRANLVAVPVHSEPEYVSMHEIMYQNEKTPIRSGFKNMSPSDQNVTPRWEQILDEERGLLEAPLLGLETPERVYLSKLTASSPHYTNGLFDMPKSPFSETLDNSDDSGTTNCSSPVISLKGEDQEMGDLKRSDSPPSAKIVEDKNEGTINKTVEGMFEIHEQHIQDMEGLISESEINETDNQGSFTSDPENINSNKFSFKKPNPKVMNSRQPLTSIINFSRTQHIYGSRKRTFRESTPMNTIDPRIKKARQSQSSQAQSQSSFSSTSHMPIVLENDQLSAILRGELRNDNRQMIFLKDEAQLALLMDTQYSKYCAHFTGQELYDVRCLETNIVNMYNNRAALIKGNSGFEHIKIRGFLRCGRGCPHVFNSAIELATHCDEDHNCIYRPWKCSKNDCYYSVLGFHSRSEVKRHCSSTHGLTQYRCLLCTKMYARSDALLRHCRHAHLRSPN